MINISFFTRLLKTLGLINAREKLALKELAKEFIRFSQSELEQLVDDGELLIVGDDHE